MGRIENRESNGKVIGEPILELKNVKTTFKVPKGILKAVNGVDLTIYKGETVGLVG